MKLGDKVEVYGKYVGVVMAATPRPPGEEQGDDVVMVHVTRKPRLRLRKPWYRDDGRVNITCTRKDVTPTDKAMHPVPEVWH